MIQRTAALALGLAYALTGRLDEALPMLEEAEAQAPAVRIFDTSTARTALCTGYLLAGRIDDAALLAPRLAELAAAHGYRGSLARAWRLLGEIAAHRDPPEVPQAEEHYCGALALAEELAIRPLVAHCHLGLARLYRRAGEREKAEEQVAAALTLYRDLGMDFWLEKADGEALR